MRETIESGVAYIPEDRFLNGIFSTSSISSNVTAQVITKHKYFIDKQIEREITDEYVGKLSIKISSRDDEIRSLSGGNQQKVVISRILSAPALLPITAEVSILESGRSVFTNPQDGTYEFTHASGSFTVQAEAYGYRSQSQTVNVPQDGEAEFG